MKLTVLTENVAGGSFLAEHGLSYLIENKGEKILFDTGHSDVFIKNAENLKVDLTNDIQTVVLSHGHWDHGNGLRYLKDKTLITHPGSFIKRYRIIDNSYIGLTLSQSEIKDRFELKISKDPVEVSPGITFLGEVPRKNDFEAKTTSFIDESGNLDFVMDDSALAIVDKDELIVVTGCSHAGICNIINYAIEVTGVKKVRAVIGGFHLKHNNKQTKSTIEVLKSLKVQHVYPSHCTELEALAAFVQSFSIMQVKTGMVLEL